MTRNFNDHLPKVLPVCLLVATLLSGSTAAARGLRGAQSHGPASEDTPSDPGSSGGIDISGIAPTDGPGGMPGDGHGFPGPHHDQPGGHADHGGPLPPPFLPDLETSASKLAAQLVDPDDFTVLSSTDKQPKLTACNVSVAILRAAGPQAHHGGLDMVDGAIILSTGDVLRPPGPLPGPLPGPFPPFFGPGAAQGGPEGDDGHAPRSFDDQQHGDNNFKPRAHTCADYKSTAIKRSHDAVTLEFYIKAKRSGKLALSALFVTEEVAPWAKALHKSGVKADDPLHVEVDGERLEKLIDGSKVTSGVLSEKLQVLPQPMAAMAGAAVDVPSGLPPGGWMPVDVTPGDLPLSHDKPPFGGPPPPALGPAAVVSLKTLKIERNKKYHIVIRIADVGDREGDSSVLVPKHGLKVADV